MKKYVISLSDASHRKNLFNQNNKKYLGEYEFYNAVDKKYITPDKLQDIGAGVWKGWRSPYKNRIITKGEIACFLSHRNLWVECKKLNEPIVVFEDDAVVENWDEDEYKTLLESYDFVYLGRNENQPENVTSINDTLEVPCEPYNLHAYIITPKVANILLNTNITQNIIPADDYLPMMLRHFNPVAYKEDQVYQISQGTIESTVEPVDESDYYFDGDVHVLTVGSDRKKCVQLMTSAMKCGLYPINLGINVEWQGTDMTGPGGGMKLNLIREYIQNKSDHDIVIFTDAYDVFYSQSKEEIVRRFLGFNTRALFSAEQSCWPNEELADQYPESHTSHRYLNSGTFVAEVGELKKLLDSPIENSDDDQLYLTNKFLSGKYDMKLDYESYIFLTHDEKSVISKNQPFREETGCFSCVYHGNGGVEAKQHFNKLYDIEYPQVMNFFINSSNWKNVDYFDNEMIVIDFMTQDYCEQLIDMSEKIGNWGELEGDLFPAQEIRIKKISPVLWDEMEHYWMNDIAPLVEQYWRPLKMYGLRDAFTMRYALDTQVSLALHHDASLVTGSVKLNDDYQGAEVVFPRQGFSNKDVPVGRCILFPGQVTHGHECTQLISGVKYSLTMWTSRYEGDIN